MTLLQILTAAILHGLFDAVPTGGDLLDLRILNGVPDADRLALQIAVYFGLAGAALLFSAPTLWMMGRGLARRAKGKRDPGAPLFFFCLPNMVLPIVLWWLLSQFPSLSLSVLPMTIMTAILAIALMMADHLGVTVRRLEHLGWMDSMIFAVTGALGLLPGLGRTVVLVITGRLLGYERPDLLRLGILGLWPVLLVQAISMIFALSQQVELIFSTDLLLAFAASFLCAALSLSIAFGWLQRRSYFPWALIRLAIALTSLLLMIFGIAG